MTVLLNARLSELLGNCVEEYIKSATPIASSVLAGKDGNFLSSATIRNDLKMLDQMGFLHQVHTSSGRVPTMQAYRAYVDMVNQQTFAADLINDLTELSRLVDRIERKIHGTGAYPIKAWNYDQVLERRRNIHKLLEIPDLEISALYLLIKEKIDNGR